MKKKVGKLGNILLINNINIIDILISNMFKSFYLSNNQTKS